MRKRVFPVVFTVVLAGCTPLNLFYKEGIPVQRLNHDLADCKLRAFRDVPVDQDTRYIPGQEIPKTICDSNGYCQSIWVQITPDRIETYDANKGLRNEYIHACMTKSGYQRVRLPACDDTVINATPLAATKVLPSLASNSCAIHLNSGQYQIVTPQP